MLPAPTRKDLALTPCLDMLDAAIEQARIDHKTALDEASAALALHVLSRLAGLQAETEAMMDRLGAPDLRRVA